MARAQAVKRLFKKKKKTEVVNVIEIGFLSGFSGLSK